MAKTKNLTDSVKKMNINEFIELGYLQEVNRLFFHPLGLALEAAPDKDDNYRLTGIWDCRNEPEGIIFDIKNSSKERRDRFGKRAMNVMIEKSKHEEARIKLLGTIVEQI